MQTHSESVRRQFDSQAGAYLRSAVHAQGADLQAAAAYVAEHVKQAGTGLDLGCGAGHLSFALAPVLSKVVATDASPGMLKVVEQAATERGLQTIETLQTMVESLPFADASFDVVATRYSAHHWSDVPAALAEARRVMKPDGLLLVIDVLGYENPLVDTHFQTIEVLRDTSHVRDYADTEWRRMLADAGFAVAEKQAWPVRLEFSSWVQRMRTPELLVQAIRTLQQGAPAPVQEALQYEAEGSFTMVTALYACRAQA